MKIVKNAFYTLCFSLMLAAPVHAYLDPAVANAFALVHALGFHENQPKKPVVPIWKAAIF